MKEVRKDLQKVCKLYQAKDEGKVTLLDCPVGLFVWNGILVLKTEYSHLIDDVIRPECYLIKSGELFHGGCDTTTEFNNLMVTPVIVGFGLKPEMPVSKAAGGKDLGNEEA